MRHLNSLNYFSLGVEFLWTHLFTFDQDFIDTDNFEGQRSTVLSMHQIIWTQPPGKSIQYE